MEYLPIPFILILAFLLFFFFPPTFPETGYEKRKREEMHEEFEDFMKWLEKLNNK